MRSELLLAACIIGVLLLVSLWDPQVAGALSALVAVGLVVSWYMYREAKSGGVDTPAMRIDDAKAAVSDIATVKTLTTMTTTTDADLSKIMSDPTTQQMLYAVSIAKMQLPPDQVAAIDNKIQTQTSQLTAMFVRSGLQLATKSIIGSAVALGTLGTGESLADMLFLIYSSADLAIGVSRVGKEVMGFVGQAQNLDGFTESARRFLADPKVTAISARICGELQSLVGRLAGVLGDIVSLLVPVDPGFLRAGVTSMVLASSAHAYSGLMGLFSKLPKKVIDILLDPAALESWLIDVLNSSLPNGDRGVIGTLKGVLSVMLAFPAMMIPIVGPFVWVYLTGSGWAKIISGTGIDLGRIKKLSDLYIKPRIKTFAKAVSVSANLCLLSLYTASTNCNISGINPSLQPVPAISGPGRAPQPSQHR